MRFNLKIRLLVLFIFFWQHISAAEIRTIIVSPESFKEYLHLAKDAYIYCDTNNQYNFHQIRTYENLFTRINTNNLNIGFTNKTYWVKFRINYIAEQSEEYYLEVARPITNEVKLYHPDKYGRYELKQSGDGIEFDKRDVPHRKSVFKITLYPNVVNTYYLKLSSDGEVINLPIKLWKQEALRDTDYKDQFFQGIYYGVLFFVFIIYFFFFLALKEESFKFYVLYVLSIALLQFSLDGLSFNFIFPNNIWWANKILLISACCSLIFVTLYARRFLSIPERLPKYDKLLLTFTGIGIISLIFTVISEKTYQITFPIINAGSLLATIAIFISIIILKNKKYKVCPFFFTAFTLLITGAIIFILNNLSLVPNSFLTENGLKLGSGLEVIFLSLSMANKFKEIQQEKEKAQQLAYEKLEELNRVTQNINIELEKQVQLRTEEINKQKILIEQKNKDITDSIRYARRIQQAVLPNEATINQFLPESFICFMPRDIVSGDFYWYKYLKSTVYDTEKGEILKPLLVFSVADCTGHGVPGAFMSFIGINILNASAKEPSVNSPGEALDYLNDKLNELLNSKNIENINDGMDIAMIALDLESGDAQFAGANNPVLIFRKNNNEYTLEEIKGDKQPIGANKLMEHHKFTNHTFNLKKGDTIYIFTDGYADQFGGPDGKKYKYKRFKEFLLSIQNESMEIQKNKLYEEFINWKGDLEQVDDICIIGVRF